MKIKTTSLVFLTTFFFVLTISYAGENITNEFARRNSIRSHNIEKPEKNVWVRKNYDEDGKIVEIIPQRWVSVAEGGVRLKRHGRYQLFDSKGDCIKSQWYFKDKTVSESEYAALLKEEGLDEPLKKEEVPEDKKTKAFVENLSLAWQKGNDAECKSIITMAREKKPDWIPAIIAEYGYITFIEHNDQKAAKVLGSLKELINEEGKVSEGKKSQLETRIWNHFKATYNSYYEQSVKGTNGRFKIGDMEIDFAKARETYVLFPPSDLMTSYILASGIKIDLSALANEVLLQSGKVKGRGQTGVKEK